MFNHFPESNKTHEYTSRNIVLPVCDVASSRIGWRGESAFKVQFPLRVDEHGV